MRGLIFAGAAGLLAASCATPDVVGVEQPGDQRMSCAELEAAIDEAREFEDEARDARGVTGTNAAAAVLFWPGLLATYVNTEDAIDAAQDRQEHLMDIYRSRSCE